jgi:polysaccharide deacetylase family protein (PEP-CTERM system associated)
VSNTPCAFFLFSVDLEDVRDHVKNGTSYAPRVVQNTQLYLSFLRESNSKCTFFVVGNVLRKYPELIQTILEDGHEIACHTNEHIPLDKLGQDGFRRDLDCWFASAKVLGIDSVKGFRAPTFSLTEQTSWAYSILKEYGFEYSSSVLPAHNPLYGWKDFGGTPKLKDGILEIPMNLVKIGPFQIPYGGGVYFRMLPQSIILNLFNRAKTKGISTLGYFHPYDLDIHQERFMHGGIGDNRFYNALMYMGRKSVIPKLNSLITAGFEISRYDTYSEKVKSQFEQRND